MPLRLASGTTLPFQPDSRILIVGDGNFSFSASLVTQMSHLGWCGNIFCTAYDSESDCHEKYRDAHTFIQTCLSHNATVLFDVDATKLHEDSRLFDGSPEWSWDFVIFNFPHTGDPQIGNQQDSGEAVVLRSIRANQDLLREFFTVTAAILGEDGKILLTLKDCYPYSEWQIKVQACVGGFVQESTIPFTFGDFPGYHHKQTLRRAGKKGAVAGVAAKAVTHMFGKSTTTAHKKKRQLQTSNVYSVCPTSPANSVASRPGPTKALLSPPSDNNPYARTGYSYIVSMAKKKKTQVTTCLSAVPIPQSVYALPPQEEYQQDYATADGEEHNYKYEEQENTVVAGAYQLNPQPVVSNSNLPPNPYCKATATTTTTTSCSSTTTAALPSNPYSNTGQRSLASRLPKSKKNTPNNSASPRTKVVAPTLSAPTQRKPVVVPTLLCAPTPSKPPQIIIAAQNNGVSNPYVKGAGNPYVRGVVITPH